ncbi:MAG: 2-oxoacid:acceptor oxidoreductase subunit alpha [Nanopusillaceae archaeon]
MTKYNILIGGKAGQGIDFAADILSIALIKEGYYVFNYRYYQSLIRGGHNYNIVSFSEEPVYCFDEDIDIIVALDQLTVDKHAKKLKKDGIILGDVSIKHEKKLGIDLKSIYKEINIDSKYENTILLTALWKILGFDKETLINAFLYKKRDEKNIEIIKTVFEKNIELNIKLKSYKKREKYFLSGSEGIAYGAIFSGLDIYLAYPMTPATQVMHILASLKNKYNIITYQPDNEIGVINMGLGASYAGAKVMVGSSGGGLDLMGEGISFSGMAEIPIVIYWAQRYGPSTGIATATSQDDLLSAIYIGHGEFPKMVIAPGDPFEAFKRTMEAFYFAYKYNIPVILLSDLFLAESKMSSDDIEVSQFPTDRNIELNPTEEYKYYKITEQGYMKRIIPGFNKIVKISSYEHNEDGIQIYDDHKIAEKMHAKRLIKMYYIEKEIYNFKPYEVYGKGENLIISWGSSKMPILEALKSLKNWRYLHISYLYPFPKKIVEILKNSNEIVIIENNLTGQLRKLINMETGFFIEKSILKHDGLPFKPAEIIDEIQKIS